MLMLTQGVRDLTAMSEKTWALADVLKKRDTEVKNAVCGKRLFTLIESARVKVLLQKSAEIKIKLAAICVESASSS